MTNKEIPVPSTQLSVAVTHTHTHTLLTNNKIYISHAQGHDNVTSFYTCRMRTA